jgi:hypothetical protein
MYQHDLEGRFRNDGRIGGFSCRPVVVSPVRLKQMAWNTTFAEEGVWPRASAINRLDLMYSARRYMKARSLVPVFLSYRSVNYAGVSGYSKVLYVEVTLRDMSKRCRIGSDGEVLCVSRATL